MHRHIHYCRRAVCAVVASLMIGSLLLSACGRVAEGAEPDTAVPSSAPTAALAQQQFLLSFVQPDTSLFSMTAHGVCQKAG